MAIQICAFVTGDLEELENVSCRELSQLLPLRVTEEQFATIGESSVWTMLPLDIDLSQQLLQLPQELAPVSGNNISTSELHITHKDAVESEEDFNDEAEKDSCNDPEYVTPSEVDASSARSSDADQNRELTVSERSNEELNRTTNMNNPISENTVRPENTERPTRGRKRKHIDQNKEIAKKRRHSNQPYYDYKGKLIAKKSFNNFQCTCNLKCHSTTSAEMREEEFNKYWSISDYNGQHLFIGTCVQEVAVKRSVALPKKKRSYARQYNLKSTPVCRDMFVKTLGISTKRVNTALCKLRSGSVMDKRGKAQAGMNKLSDVKTEEVKHHINKLPRYKSHYRRAESHSEYLPPEMTLQKMYNLYKNEVDSPTSFSSYRRIFLKFFDLKFKTLKKDTCNVCDSLSARVCSAVGEEKAEIEELHNLHKDLWVRARSKMNEDLKKATKEETFECITFDLEKTLPLPRIPTNVIFYKRQLWVYNAGIHSGKHGKGYCYVWVENQAGRGAQEIGSCIMKHIEKEIQSGITHLVLWSDSCGGQNRNIKMVLILKACLESHPTLEDIRLKFLVSGHSFLPNDADFSDIECALKHVQRLYLPSDYVAVMKSCRKKKPFLVTEMTSNDFFGTEKLEKIIVNRKTNQNNDKINWLKLREIKLTKKEPTKIYVRTDFESTFDKIDVARHTPRGRQQKHFSYKQSLVPMWTKGKPIAAPKLKDLKSVMHLIPFDAKAFYASLCSSEDVEDDVDGFCATPDFVVDVDEV